METGRLPPLYPGERSEALEVRALLTETKDSRSSRSLAEVRESLRLNRPMVLGWEGGGGGAEGEGDKKKRGRRMHPLQPGFCTRVCPPL